MNETSKAGAPKYKDVARLAKALIVHAPERIIWASNGPPVHAPTDNRPDDADLPDLLLDWAPGEKKSPHDPRRQSRRAVRLRQGLAWRPSC